VIEDVERILITTLSVSEKICGSCRPRKRNDGTRYPIFAEQNIPTVVEVVKGIRFILQNNAAVFATPDGTR
jgi:hypothetical protein